MLRIRPRPTLFPYTTLFRSRARRRARRHLARVPDQGRRDPRLGQARDRKSTRLNSSHTVISYAVFCLKKKNTTRNVVCLMVDAVMQNAMKAVFAVQHRVLCI